MNATFPLSGNGFANFTLPVGVFIVSFIINMAGSGVTAYLTTNIVNNNGTNWGASVVNGSNNSISGSFIINNTSSQSVLFSITYTGSPILVLAASSIVAIRIG